MLIDEPLLRRLDADPVVKRVGRSEVVRRAATAYLRTARARSVAPPGQRLGRNETD